MKRLDRFQNEVMAGGSVDEHEADKTANGWHGAIGLTAIVALFAWLAVANGWMFMFVVGVLVSVFLHESGHFVTARLTGMKATQFFIGFGPRLFSFRRGDTEYGVRALPLGAFVRIIGMNNLDEVPPADEAHTYRQKSFPRRLLVISAGSIMHILLAIGLLFSVYAFRGELADAPGAEVAGVESSSGAAQAGLREGDVILAVNGRAVDGPEQLGEAIRSNEPGDTVTLALVDDGVERTVEATLGANPGPGERAGTAYLGTRSSEAATWESRSVGEAAVNSVVDVFPVAWQSTKGVVQVLNPVNLWNHLTNRTDDPTTRPTTLVGVTELSGDVGRTDGVAGVLYLLAALNVFVGVFNMFPLLPLDGGHAAIAVYERIRERRSKRRYFADVSKAMPFAFGVIALLLALFMTGLYLDITRPLG